MKKSIRLNKFEIIVYRLIPNSILRKILPKLKKFDFFNGTKNTQTPITFENWYQQKVLGWHKNVPWPVHKTSQILNWENIDCGIDTSPGYSQGNFISAQYGKILIGDYTQIGPNVGIIADNHNVVDSREFISKDITIGKYCWIGFGAVILPGVTIGDFTIVGANAVVADSFPDGYCIIVGNKARKIKNLNKEDCIPFQNENKYIGYFKYEHFTNFKN